MVISQPEKYPLILIHQLDQGQNEIAVQDKKITVIYEYPKEFEKANYNELAYMNRKKIGFKTKEGYNIMNEV